MEPRQKSKPGFRLSGLEVLNWGTFHNTIRIMTLHGDNTLLTGDIGSGKSTLVDAITTLLVPHHRITYNKAAGAETKERTLRSYVLGEYKSETDEMSQKAKAVSLRDNQSYSVLLARFSNDALGQHVSIAQVFWFKELTQRQPERFFVVAPFPLTIKKDFTGFGPDIAKLRRRLKRDELVFVETSFNRYSAHFRRLLGLGHQQALELFHQTVSMKSVGNLTEFVRLHMLEKGVVEEKIESLKQNFDNLNQAYLAVKTAREQIDQLTPLVNKGHEYQTHVQHSEQLRSCRDALSGYFATIEHELLQQRLAQLAHDIARFNSQLSELDQYLDTLRDQESNLRLSIAENGGRRLQELEQEIRHLEGEQQRRIARSEDYHDSAKQLGLSKVRREAQFWENQDAVKALLAEWETARQELRQQADQWNIELHQVQDQRREVDAELESLRQRKSQIPRGSLELREQMADALGLADDELPFVGELLQVRNEEKDWEGAVERVLRGFGLSLLVDESHYENLSDYVDQTHLRQRLVYYRIKDRFPSKAIAPSPQSLINKLLIKPDHPFYDWLENELQRHYDYACCESMADFRHLPKAITQRGQIKSGGKRHEKDDRHSIHDRRRYILGWTNEAKIRALEQEQQTLQQQEQALLIRLAQAQKEDERYQHRQTQAHYLLKVKSYTEIHWEETAIQIAQLKAEKQEIESSSDLLKTLESQLAQVKQEIAECEVHKKKKTEDIAKLGQQQEDRSVQLEKNEAVLESVTNLQRETLFSLLDDICQQVLGDKKLHLNNVDSSQKEVRNSLQIEIDSISRKRDNAKVSTISQMKDFKYKHPVTTSEMDDEIEAFPDYEALLDTLTTEDLPRHEVRFKERLNEETIQGVALLKSQLEQEQESIEAKINAINRSLHEIAYNPGSYIKLEVDNNPDLEIKEFREDLRACLSHGLDTDDLYNEEKFLSVKQLVDRFNGREGMAEMDKRWTQKVIDVRNWFNFSATERWAEDDTERERYDHSGGKSGGQKEKLAYTILASALAYQFGVVHDSQAAKSFRFVVIDEAFGRGSDESTRYALDLFQKLDLQLLIVTPLQKIHVIEDYIQFVHFVYNEDGKNSHLKNLTIAEYYEQKEQFLGGMQQAYSLPNVL